VKAGVDFRTALFDVDGTLIDSNGAHAETWARSLQDHDVPLAAAAIRPFIGMGGDKLLSVVAGIDIESSKGRAIDARKKELFAEQLPRLQPTPGARALIQALRDVGVEIAVATSAEDAEMQALLERAGVDDLVALHASSDDASESKPDPDIVHAALGRAGASPEVTILVGDTPYDIEAAGRAGVRTVALRCGGHWPDERLRSAVAIFDHPAAFLLHLRQA